MPLGCPDQHHPPGLITHTVVCQLKAALRIRSRNHDQRSNGALTTPRQDINRDPTAVIHKETVAEGPVA